MSITYQRRSLPEHPKSRIGFGLGDAVALVAQPIAKGVDFVAGTHLANCSSCTGTGGRKERWNNFLHLPPPKQKTS